MRKTRDTRRSWLGRRPTTLPEDQRAVGTTRSRVNALMGKFKKGGFIEEDGGKLYISTSCLPRICDDDRTVAAVAPAMLSRPSLRRRSDGVGQDELHAFA